MGAASNWRPNSIFQVSGAASYFLAIRKDTFKRVGGYNEDFPYAGFEDGEFADRLRKEGINTMLNTKVCVYHNESDRLDMKSWLDRKFREGVTRKVSVKLGNARYELNLSKFKKTVFEMLHYFRAPLIALIRISNHKLLDGLSFKLIRSLEGAHIWKGYSQNQQT
jgi:GT2 family glycosyltransferase